MHIYAHKLNWLKDTVNGLLAVEQARLEKLSKAIIPVLMSSEKSCNDDDNVSFVVGPLPYRSEKYNNFIDNIDNEADKRLSIKAKRMRSSRNVGSA